MAVEITLLISAPLFLAALVTGLIGFVIFSTGLLLSLPLLAVLLVTNTALGVLTRAAPQLNLFAIGFPITMTAGFSALILLMSNFGPVVQSLFEHGFEAVPALLEALSPAAK